VSGTALEELSVVFSLRYLVTLFAERCQIKEIPASVGGMKSLEFLRLTNNRLTMVHENIGLLSRLRELLLSHNFLHEIPCALGELNRLTDNEFSFFSNPGAPVTVEALRRLWARTFWQKKLHTHFGTACSMMQLAILCSARRQRLPYLSVEVWLHIFSFTQRHDYNVVLRRPLPAASDL